MDMSEGLSHYGELTQKHVRNESAGNGPEPIAHAVSDTYYTRDELWDAEDKAVLRCPDCGTYLSHTKWINQGDHRYMALAICGTDGAFLMRIRMRHEEDGTWHANHLLYRADEAMVASYYEKQAHPRRRRRRKKRG